MKIRFLSIFIMTVFVAVAYFLPWLAVFYVVCAILDLGVQKTLKQNDIKRYFLGDDFITWLSSPFNLLADLLSWGRPRYLKMEDLPEICQQEIHAVLNSFDHEEMIQTLADKLGENGKGMVFFKWYGVNLDNSLNIEAMHHSYRYVKTIGVSIFNKQESFGRHFGPLRFTHRVLVNLNPIKHDGIFLEVDGYRHYWHEDPMFIFDDTYIHRSRNESNTVRCVVFIDIVRPSRFFARVLGWFANIIGFEVMLLSRVNKRLWDFFFDDWVTIK